MPEVKRIDRPSMGRMEKRCLKICPSFVERINRQHMPILTWQQGWMGEERFG